MAKRARAWRPGFGQLTMGLGGAQGFMPNEIPQDLNAGLATGGIRPAVSNVPRPNQRVSASGGVTGAGGRGPGSGRPLGQRMVTSAAGTIQGAAQPRTGDRAQSLGTGVAALRPESARLPGPGMAAAQEQMLERARQNVQTQRSPETVLREIAPDPGQVGPRIQVGAVRQAPFSGIGGDTAAGGVDSQGVPIVQVGAAGYRGGSTGEPLNPVQWSGNLAPNAIDSLPSDPNLAAAATGALPISAIPVSDRGPSAHVTTEGATASAPSGSVSVSVPFAPTLTELYTVGGDRPGFNSAMKQILSRARAGDQSAVDEYQAFQAHLSQLEEAKIIEAKRKELLVEERADEREERTDARAAEREAASRELRAQEESLRQAKSAVSSAIDEARAAEREVAALRTIGDRTEAQEQKLAAAEAKLEQASARARGLQSKATELTSKMGAMPTPAARIPELTPRPAPITTERGLVQTDVDKALKYPGGNPMPRWVKAVDRLVYGDYTRNTSGGELGGEQNTLMAVRPGLIDPNSAPSASNLDEAIDLMKSQTKGIGGTGSEARLAREAVLRWAASNARARAGLNEWKKAHPKLWSAHSPAADLSSHPSEKARETVLSSEDRGRKTLGLYATKPEKPGLPLTREAAMKYKELGLNREQAMERARADGWGF